VPTAAFLHPAGRRLGPRASSDGFPDEMIRAIVKTGQYSDPAVELLADVLIKRRDRSARSSRPSTHREPRARSGGGTPTLPTPQSMRAYSSTPADIARSGSL
jgi:hypothetical protein